MNEVLSIIAAEAAKVRYGTVVIELVMHDGQVRYVTTTTTARHNIAHPNKETKK